MKAPEEVEEKEDLETNSDGFSILVVEDNEELKAFLKSILSENYTVITASNGEEGLQHAVDDLPDLIISDVMMPVMDGLEATRRIRAMKRPDARTIPIIAMTANAFAEDRQLAFAAGMDMHIAKPLEGSEMVETLERLVKSSRK